MTTATANAVAAAINTLFKSIEEENDIVGASTVESNG